MGLRISAFSDGHGYLPEPKDIHESDLLFICGDIMPPKIELFKEDSHAWLMFRFIPWTEKLNVDKVILVAGNHDRIFEIMMPDEIQSLFKESKIKYLNCETYNYISNDGLIYRIYGSPYCHVFGNYSFMVSDEIIKQKMSNMPEDIDFMLTHDAPYGCSDSYDGIEHAGTIPVREIILERKPKYNFHGHLHESNHEFEKLGDTLVRCVSLNGENNLLKYNVTYMEI